MGFGGLQGCASACDIQAIKSRKGSFDDGELPNRALNFAAGKPLGLDGLGDSFFIAGLSFSQCFGLVGEPSLRIE